VYFFSIKKLKPDSGKAVKNNYVKNYRFQNMQTVLETKNLTIGFLSRFQVG